MITLPRPLTSVTVIRSRSALLVVGLLVLFACSEPPPPRGVVVAPEPQAAEIGAEILRRGGNAVDAAVAVQMTLAVTFPVAGNLGGGGFMLIATPTGEVEALDYRETAPGAARSDLFLDENGDVIEHLSLRSHLAAGVPGSVMGLWQAHQKYGSLPWSDLLAPAIELATSGLILNEWTAASFAKAARVRSELPERFASIVNFGDYYHGAAGSRLIQAELAETLRRIAIDGPDGFYRGETARLLVDEVARGGGIISLDDLAGYEAIWREPVQGVFHGRRILSMPPPSSGGIALIQFLNMFEIFHAPPHNSAKQIHVIAEIAKRVFADRAVYLGDSDFYDVPMSQLIDKNYCRQRAQSVSLMTKSDPQTVNEGKIESEQTTHLSIVDRNGMAVSSTTTLNDSYGSGLVVTGAGFLLNNEMDDFSAKPGVPNLYGVIGAEANKIEANKRMLSSMSPTIVFNSRGRLSMVLGSPGGPKIFTSIFQVIINSVDYGLDIESAVNAPRFHHQWPPRAPDNDTIYVEEKAELSLPEETLDRLRGKGYTITPRKPIGIIQAIEIVDGVAVGVSDRRGIGAVAYE